MSSPIFTHRTTLPLALGAAFLLALQAIPTLHAATYYWDTNDSTAGFGTAGGTWAAPTTNNSTQGWSASSAGTNSLSGNTTTTTSDALNFGTASDGLAAGTITLSANVSAGSITFGSASGNITLGSANRTITLGSTPTITVNSSNATIVAKIAGSTGLTKNGTGILIVPMASTYSGTTTVNAGTLRLENLATNGGADLTSTPAATFNINNGSKLVIYTNAGGNNRVVSNGDTFNFDSNGGGTLEWSNGNMLLQYGNWHGFVTNGGLQNVITTTNGAYLNGQGGGILSFNVADGSDDVDLLASAYIVNALISKNGTGTMSIRTTSGANYDITIDAGTLDVGGSATLNGGSFSANVTTNGTFSYSSSATQTISSAVLGTGGVTVNGTGSLILNGANTYTGATTISAGTLQIGGAGQLGSGVYAQNISNNGTLLFASSASQTLSGVISGTGNLTQSGPGTLAVGTNTYSGATTVNGGTLQISGNLSSSALTVNSGGVISIGTTDTSAKYNAGSITINSGGGYNWTLSNGELGAVAGTDYDQITTSGALTFNNTAANPFVVYVFGDATGWDGSVNNTWNIMNAGSVTGFNSANFAVDLTNFGVPSSDRSSGTWSFGSSGGNITLSYTLQTPNYYWNGTSGNWSDSYVANTTGFTPAPPETDKNLFFTGATGTSATVTNDLASGNLSAINSITFNSTAGAYTLNASAGAAGASGGTALTVKGDITNNSASTQTINMNIALPSDSTGVINSAAGDITITGVISGSHALIKSGANTLTLSSAANNTYTGGTTVNAGTLILQPTSAFNGGTWGVSSNSTIKSGATLQLDTSAQTSSNSRQNVGTITINSGGTLDLLNTNSNVGGSIWSSGTVLGTGTIKKSGAGYQDIASGGSASSLNNFNGTILVNAGTLGVSSGSTAGSGNANLNVASGATFDIRNGTLKINSLDGAGTITATSNAGSVLNLGNNNGSGTFSGIIQNGSGALSLQKNGTGTQVLSGSNTYSGTTQINAGTIALNSNTAIGSGAITFNGGHINNTSGGSITLTNNNAQNWNGDFTFAGTNDLNMGTGNAVMNGPRIVTVSAGNLTVGGVISGSGLNLTKAGSGTLILSGNSTYTGTTTISAGTLSVSGNISSSANLTISSGGSLTGTGKVRNVILSSGGTIGAGTGTLTVGQLTSSGNITIAVGSGYNFTIGNISGGTVGTAGTDYDQITSSGVITFNNTLANPFTVNIYGTPTNWSSSGSYTWNILSGSSLTGFSSGNFVANYSAFGGEMAAGSSWTFGTSGSNLTLTYSSTGAPTWAGGTGNWSTSFSPSLTNNLDMLFTGAGGTATNNIASGTLSGIGSITFNSTAGAYTLNATTGAAGLGGTALNVGGSIINNSANLQTISATMNFNGIRTINAASGNITISGVISGAAGGITKIGNSTLTLTAVNTFNSITTIEAGTLEISGTGQLNSGTYAQNITNNGTFLFSGNNQTLSGVISGTGALTLNKTTTTLTLSGNNTYSGTTTIQAGTLQISGAGQLGSGAYSQSISNNGTFLYASTANQTLSGVISGTGALTKNATSALTLTGNNTYAGATTINAGLLRASHANALGTTAAGTTVASGATLELTGGITVGAEALNLSGTGINDSGGTPVGALRSNSGNNSYAGAITLGAASRINSDAGTLTLSGGITGTYNLTIGGAGNTTVSGNITTSTGTLTKDGDGMLTLSGNNTFSGGVTFNAGALNGGTLNINSSTALGSGAFTINGGVINNTSGSAITLTNNNTQNWNGDFTFTGTKDLNLGTGAVTMNASRIVAVSGGNLTVGGAIDGSGFDLTKAGSGTLILSGNNTYSGTTTISVGKIQIGTGGTSGSLSTSSTIINNGTLIFNRSNAVAQGTDFANGISGTGILTKNGTGTLTLSAANTYSGGTTLNTGTLVIGNTAAAGSGRITQTNGSSLLKFDTTGTIANAMSIYNVSANKTVTLSGGITVNNAVFDVASGETLTISNTINGTGGVTKNGTGTLVLSGNNTYSAPTVINSGTLEAAHANALGSNNTVQVTGGTLLVTADDAVNGKNITMSTNTLGLQFSGNYSGAIGSLTLSADSSIDLGTDSVQILLQGLNLSTYTLSFYNWTGTVGGNGTTDTDKVYVGPDLSDAALAKIWFYSGSANDSFLGTGFDLGLQQTSWDPGLSGYHIIPGSPVPEPETYATGLLLLLGGAWWMWRKRNTCQRALAGQPAEGSPKGEPRPWEGRDRLPKAAP